MQEFAPLPHPPMEPKKSWCEAPAPTNLEYMSTYTVTHKSHTNNYYTKHDNWK